MKIKNHLILTKIFRLIAILLIITPSHAMSQQSKSSLSDDEIKALLIQQSISTYYGNCPCPYNKDKAGKQCGKRSAWSKPGGESPLCYPDDVTTQMIKNYREKTGTQ